MREFDDKQRAILRRVQGSIPDSLTPYADVAAEVSAELGRPTTETDVLDLLRGLVEDGGIRRFGATLKHNKAGFGHNVMAAWRINDPALLEKTAEIATGYRAVSHCYVRRVYPEWPYNLYTMIHGRSEADCLGAVESIKAQSGVTDVALLRSIRELKKTSMKYF